MAMYKFDESSSIVRLNIGGEKFCTTVDTLTQREPHSMLAAMFSGRHTVCKDSEGLVDEITEVLNKRREDEEIGTELTRTDIIKCVQSEHARLRVNLSGLDLSKLGANLTNATLHRANLCDANLIGINLKARICLEQLEVK
ncbi:FH protein interacting protein FIP2 isoform X2 [Tanacetum coccineum]